MRVGGVTLKNLDKIHRIHQLCDQVIEEDANHIILQRSAFQDERSAMFYEIRNIPNGFVKYTYLEDVRQTRSFIK